MVNARRSSLGARRRGVKGRDRRSVTLEPESTDLLNGGLAPGLVGPVLREDDLAPVGVPIPVWAKVTWVLDDVIAGEDRPGVGRTQRIPTGSPSRWCCPSSGSASWWKMEPRVGGAPERAEVPEPVSGEAALAKVTAPTVRTYLVPLSVRSLTGRRSPGAG